MRSAAALLVAALLALALLGNAAPLHRDRVAAPDTAAMVTVEALTTAAGEQFKTLLRHMQGVVNEVTHAADQREVTVAVVVDMNDDGTVTLNGAAVPQGRSQHSLVADAVELPGVQALTVDVAISLDVRAHQVNTPEGSVQAYKVRQHIVETIGNSVHETRVRQLLFTGQRDGAVVKKGIAWVQQDDQPPVRIPLADGEPEFMPEGPHHGGPHHGRPHHDRPQHGGGPDDRPVLSDPPKDMQPVTEPAAPADEEVPPAPPADKSLACRCGEALKTALHNAYDVFNQLPFVLRLIISFFAGALCGYISLSLLACCLGGRCCRKSSAYDTNLQLYALQYTAVPADEKEALKKEKDAVVLTV